MHLPFKSMSGESLYTVWTCTKLMYFETFVLLYFHFTLLYTSTFERKFVFYCTKLAVVTCYITQISKKKLDKIIKCDALLKVKQVVCNLIDL